MSAPAPRPLLPLLVACLATTAALACEAPAPRERSNAKPKADLSGSVDPSKEANPGGTAGDNEPIPDPTRERAEGTTDGPAPPAGPLPPLTKRCATRLSIAIAGKSPSASLLASTDLAKAVDTLVGSADFAERYARFINAEFNDAPAMNATEDPIYFVAKHVITNDKPWSDLFVGPYQVKASGETMAVTSDPKGLGYFRSEAWMKRYAGNEPQGAMLVGAFRLLANTTGLELTASVGNPDDDRTENGRNAPACKSCHFESWFALDKVARLLPKKTGEDDVISFTAPTAGPQQLFGKSLADDKALLTELVASPAWRFQQCRSVVKFLYGRAENKCEAQTFDRCVDALQQQKTIRAAVAAVAKDPAVCR